jgi:hypothetical protein
LLDRLPHRHFAAGELPREACYFGVNGRTARGQTYAKQG